MKNTRFKLRVAQSILLVFVTSVPCLSTAQNIGVDKPVKSEALGFQQPQAIPIIHQLELISPISLGALKVLLGEADSLYRSERLAQAQDAIIGLLELEPNFSPAWLRLGNIWQTQGKADWAIQAYQMAVQGRLTTSTEAEAKMFNEAKIKALLNQSVLQLNQVRIAQQKIDSLQSQVENFSDAYQNQVRFLDELENEQRRLSARAMSMSERQQTAKSEKLQIIIGKVR
jgi:tetratricopeptide (TPR) repeat protein